MEKIREEGSLREKEGMWHEYKEEGEGKGAEKLICACGKLNMSPSCSRV